MLAVRGAPAIGVAAAYGMALAAERGDDLDAAFETLAASRPTAVNLRWALDAMREEPTRERAERIHEDEVERCRRMGAHAVDLFPAGARVLTHCNAGGLATGGYGTALGAVRAAHEAGRVEHVWVDETRPLLQGARLTAWELEQLGIPHAVIADGAAASFMARGEVDLVVTGADRIAANGDTANKIGTYALAVLARAPRPAARRRRADVDARPVDRDRRRDPDRGAGRRRGHCALPRAEPRVRRHAGRARHGDRHRARRASGAVRGVAAARGRGGTMILDDLDPETRATLERFGFDAATFEALRARVASGELSADANVVKGRVEPPRTGDVTTLPEPGSAEWEAARAAGLAALARGAGRAGRARRRHGDALRRRREGRGRGGRRAQLPLVEARRDRSARPRRWARRSRSR